MKNLTKILASITLLLVAFTTFSNELTNGDFELNPPVRYGNNIRHSVAPWVFTSSTAKSNIVHVDGPGGRTGYGSNGPESDASNSGSGVWRNYLDIAGRAGGSVHQSFTTPEECSGEVRFGGFFSTRGNASGSAKVEIRNGTGLSGALVGATANVSVVGGNSKTDPWTPVNFATTLSSGSTYTLVVTMDNQLNFDEAYVNFVDGPCKDDSDIVDKEPEQCLILEPKVECVANKWQVSITNNSPSFNADVLDITSLTSGVTISGSSPNWILNGALPNSSVDITVDGTITGGGKADFADLCCTTKLHLDIPDEECEIVEEEHKPHIYIRKLLEKTDDGRDVFRFIVDSLVLVNAPTVLTLTDTIPEGITLTSLDSTNTSNWSCPGLPLTGPATLVCTYVGIMPIPAGFHDEVYLYTTIDPSKEQRENCVETAFHGTNGDQLEYDGNKKSCTEIPAEDEIEEDKPEIETTKTCVFHPRFGSAQFFTCTITVTASNLTGNGVINLSDIVTDTGSSGITEFTSSDNWQCDSPPVNSPTPYNCSLSESDLLSSGGTSEIQISGYTAGSASTMDNCAINTYTDSEGNSTESNEACLSTNDEDDTEECSPPNVLIEGHCELPCENDSQCSSIEGTSCLPFYNTETLVCQQPDPPIVCGEGEVLVDGQCVISSDPISDIYLKKETISGKSIKLKDGENTTTVKPEFKLTVTNNTTATLTGIEVQDALPTPKLTFNAFSAGSPSLGVVSQTGNIVTWRIFSLAAGASATVKYSVKVMMQGPTDSVYNYAQVTAVDQVVSSVTPLTNPKSGPLNPSDNDEGRDSVTIYSEILQTQSIVIEESGEELTIQKFAPKTCKAGQKCKFTFTISNKTKKPYSGFIGITDKPRKRFGRIRGKSKGWSCKKKGREYRCGIDKLRLKPDESKKLTLTLQVPRSLSGKVENCATVEAQMPAGTPKAPKSCVTVKIINDRKCGYDDKLVNGRCVARCKSKNSNWNGVDCMVCRGGKTWNDRYKRCDKKPKEVIKSCPDHYRWSNAQKRCVYFVPKDPITKIPNCNKGTHYDSRKRRCVENARPKQCNKGTHYDAAKRRCVENRRPTKQCNKGTHYDAVKKRCVENKRNHPKGCPAGQIYLADARRCVKVQKEAPKPTGGPGSCGIGMLWNGGYKKCVPLEEGEGGGGDDAGGHP